MGCDIITGGGPGLMALANEGTRRADPHAHNRSVGIRVQLPFEQDVNAFVSQAYEHRTFFTRLHQICADVGCICRDARRHRVSARGQ